MNYFEYFSEIEQRFSQRRGSILLLSTLDWALIETWREAGIPLEAVLRGIDTAFDKHDARAHRAHGRLRKVNGLAWCAQAVMQATEEMMEASVGAAANGGPAGRDSTPSPEIAAPARESGFEPVRVAAYLQRNADALDSAARAAGLNTGAAAAAWTVSACATAERLRELAAEVRHGTGIAGAASVPGAAAVPDEAVRSSPGPMALDELDRTLTVLEERLFAALQTSATEGELVALRAQADPELAPYRARISAVQLRGVQQQFLHKRLLEARALPRLSLFYMGHE